ncbi:S-layer homology domain-containing protein [Natranaerovirga hydrolytica]|uniref:S-layer homology domain-containing protein n=1 Tax=Natranaerovirga hydrolytica TaxID=680378 RepID=UPI001049D00B
MEFKDSDEQYDWAREAIGVLSSLSIISGTSTKRNEFSPSANISRRDYTIMLVKTLDLEQKLQHLCIEFIYYKNNIKKYCQL